MIYGFKLQPNIKLSDWASNLTNYYWHIRVEGRDKAKRRRYYRYIRKEKLRLVEQLDLEQELIEAVCKYLLGFTKSSTKKLLLLLHQKPVQFKLNFN